VLRSLGTPSDGPRLMDESNRKVWSDPKTVFWYRHLDGWTDPGERRALQHVPPAARGKRILDLGVGGGRTVPLLQAISRDHVGLDYTQALVDACRSRYPSACVFHGDARDLSRFPTASFDLVVFSFTGIRRREPRRPCEYSYKEAFAGPRRSPARPRSAGRFLFSTHNRRGPSHGGKPSFGVHPTRNPFKLAAGIVRAAARARRTLANYLRNAELASIGDGLSIMNAAAHDHGIVIHPTSLDGALRELSGVGFRPAPLVFDNVTGRRLALDEDTAEVFWFHLVVSA
jgi:SAM-dependent methyltransferase